VRGFPLNILNGLSELYEWEAQADKTSNDEETRGKLVHFTENKLNTKRIMKPRGYERIKQMERYKDN
jgi:hypothetical protein